MTDRVLTEEEVTVLGRPSTPWDSITRREVIASHRLLQERVKELEALIPKKLIQRVGGTDTR